MADLGVIDTEVRAGPNARRGRGTAGAVVSAGQPLYQDAWDGHHLKPAQADAAVTATVVGIALHGAVRGQPIEYQMPGDYVTLGAGAAVVAGEVYCLSAAAAGGIAPVGDLVVGNQVSVLGVGRADAALQLFGGSSGVAKA